MNVNLLGRLCEKKFFSIILQRYLCQKSESFENFRKIMRQKDLAFSIFTERNEGEVEIIGWLESIPEKYSDI